MIRVILVESVPLFRAGIRTALERFDGCLILESTDCTEIMELAQVHHPGCAIIDGGLTTLDPLETCCMLRQQVPEIGILILAPTPDEERLFRFIRAGASAFELRSISPEALVEDLYRMSRGEYLSSSEVLLAQPSARFALALKTRAHAEVGAANKTQATPLSPRELEMLRYIARGNSNKEIAKALKISDQTVKNHITSMLKKLSVNDRTAAVMYAFRHAWITLE